MPTITSSSIPIAAVGALAAYFAVKYAVTFSTPRNVLTLGGSLTDNTVILASSGAATTLALLRPEMFRF